MGTTTPPPPKVTLDQLKALDQFLVAWDPTDGWPATAPLTVEQRNAVSECLWNEAEITWLRVLGTVLNSASDKAYREVSVMNHFNFFTQDVERMFAYWMRYRHLKDYGLALLQTYLAARTSSLYPALAGIVPLAETVMKSEGYRNGFSADYRKFFRDHQTTGVGTRIESVFVEMLYEKDPAGGMDNRERFNRHKLAHGISPQAVTPLDVLSGCLILDMVVSTVETNGQLFTRILR